MERKGEATYKWTPLSKGRGSNLVENLRRSFIDDGQHILNWLRNQEKKHLFAAPFKENDMIIYGSPGKLRENVLNFSV